MELCTARGIISNLPQNPIIPIQSHKPQFQFLKQTRRSSGFKCYNSRNWSLRSTISEETSAETARLNDNESRFVTAEVEKKDDYDDDQVNAEQQEGSVVDNLQLPKFLEDLDLKIDYEDTYSILAFGGGGAVALWLAAAVVGAIDSIPVLPKVLELVGLGYTVWFSSRYLIFKKNRDELVAKVEQIKQQVLGSKGD